MLFTQPAASGHTHAIAGAYERHCPETRPMQRLRVLPGDSRASSRRSWAHCRALLHGIAAAAAGLFLADEPDNGPFHFDGFIAALCDEFGRLRAIIQEQNHGLFPRVLRSRLRLVVFPHDMF